MDFKLCSHMKAIETYPRGNNRHGQGVSICCGRRMHSSLDILLFVSPTLPPLFAPFSSFPPTLTPLCFPPVPPPSSQSDVVRRRELVKGLRHQLSLLGTSSHGTNGLATGTTRDGSAASGGGGVPGGLRTLAQQRREIIHEQDELLEDLGKGVDRLKMQGLVIRDETGIHHKLLEDIDGDVEAAASSLRMEARHAQRIREQSTVCRLYICIAILLIILVLLLVIGFT